MIPVIWTIRYSILFNSPSVNLNKGIGFDVYRSRLFDPARMSSHHWLFSNVAIPSLATQQGVECGRTIVQVLASTEMPQVQKSALESSIKPYPWADIFYISPEEKQVPYRYCVARGLDKMKVPDGCLYINARLDDDDAIASNFSVRLRGFASDSSVGYGISFGKGYVGVFDEGRRTFDGMYLHYKPMIAIGLAVIGKVRDGRPSHDIFGLGAHAKIDRRHPVILDSSMPSFIRTSYSKQDSGGAIYLSQKYEPIDPQAVLEHFGIQEHLLPSVARSNSRLAIEKRKAIVRGVKERTMHLGRKANNKVRSLLRVSGRN